jgi:hypothetical protein
MVFMLPSLVLTTLCATADVARSSRNLEPLTKKRAAPAASPAAEQPAAAAETVTKVTFLGPRAGWGFVKSTSPYYGLDGKRLGALPGGTLFTYSDVKASSKNAVLVSTVKRGNAWEGPFLLDCTDIAGYEGSPDAIDPALLQSLSDYFTLSGKIADRKAELTEAALSANPHFESAKRAQQAYQDSVAKAADMERQMNTLTGARKSKALDALRAFKYEQVRIKAQADQAAAAYKAWKDAHPLDPSKLAADPQLLALQKQRQLLASKVANLVPQDE